MKVSEYGSVQRHPIKTLRSLPQEFKHSQLPKKLQVQTDTASEASHKHIKTLKLNLVNERPSNPKDVHREQVTPVVNSNILLPRLLNAATLPWSLNVTKAKHELNLISILNIARHKNR